MKPVSKIALAALMLLAACATAPKPSPDERAGALTRVMNQLHAAQKAGTDGDSSKIPQLAELVPTLNSVIAAGPNDGMSAAAYYYQGEIAFAINAERQRQGQPLDPKLTADAANGFRTAFLARQNVPQWQVFYVNAAYRMGNTAFIAGDYNAAHAAFQSCADLGHPGCMNSLADLLLAEPPPNDLNLAASFELSKRTVSTGTEAVCAGSFSAVTVADFIHFKVTPEATGDALAWLAQARDLARQAEGMTGRKDPCHTPIVDIDEYLMRADAGDIRPALLEAVIRDADRPSDRALAGYLRGRIDEAEFRRQLESARLNPYQLCDVEFSLLWNDSRRGRKAAAGTDFAALIASPPMACLEGRTLARKLGYPAS